MTRAADLAPRERRLLRHIGRIDPNVCVTMPGEWEAAQRLADHGLIKQVGPATSDSYRITDAGRAALR